MPPRVALLLCFGLIVWLFHLDRRRYGRTSPALWLPLIWLFIIASRPFSTWFGVAPGEDPLEGSPLDRLFFFSLILASVAVLMKRNLDWPTLMKKNQWLVIFFIYLAVSVLWSDYPFVAFKRWIKDVGNIFMVLVILTDTDPLRAVKVVWSRCCYLVIPLSVVLVKYFPNFGSYYDMWSGQPSYCGVTMNKNELGMVLFACGLSLILILLELRSRKNSTRLDYCIFLGLSALAVWLLRKAQSSTAIGCMVLAAFIFFGLRFAAIRRKVATLGTWSVIVVALLLLLNWMFNLVELVTGLLGRDMTFTGRTEIWRRVLEEDINPLVGAGYNSFWTGERVAHVSRGYVGFGINEAHNAFLNSYLNTGWIGIFFLVAVLLAGGSRIKRHAITGETFGAFRLTCLLASLLYGMTEAIFNGLSPLWFLLLLIIIEPVSVRHLRSPFTNRSKNSSPSRPAPAPHLVRFCNLIWENHFSKYRSAC